MARGIKLKHSVKRLDNKSATLLFNTLGSHENALRLKRQEYWTEIAKLDKAITAIVKTKLILLRVELR